MAELLVIETATFVYGTASSTFYLLGIQSYFLGIPALDPLKELLIVDHDADYVPRCYAD